MGKKSRVIWLILILAGASAGLWYGWRQFWFMTDDALIAFRYVSNSILGFGYVWNPPPFRPVEGYTSFLWVALLDFIWRWFGTEPPQVANWLSLFFSFLTIGLVSWIVMRLSLGERLARIRLILLALVLLGTLSNRTFLAWTSSGLETALFNFCFTLWISIAVLSRRRDAVWAFGLTGSAALVYLTRPDGLLVLASSVALSGWWLWSKSRRSGLSGRNLLGLIPLTVPVIHLGWRRATYGEWLPNTYYAKHVAAWPEAGLRYLASFMLEYGLWLWIAALVWLVIQKLRQTPQSRLWVRGLFRIDDPESHRRLCFTIAVATVVAHISYYTLIIGGDHFEYRVFSYLVPFFFVSIVWMLNRLVSDRVITAVVLGLFILISWPLPWTHWAQTKNLSSRDDTWAMWVPISPELPSGFQWYAEPFDRLQSWLIERHICMRHQEHKVFYQYLSSQYPERSMRVPDLAGEYPIAACQSVGVPGWVFPKVTVLDAFGLNDYVVARHRAYPREFRLMAHDRHPPEGYLESFSFNYGRMANRSSGFLRREYEITAEDIESTEQFWIDRIVHGREVPFSYAMLNRIGESLLRTAKLDSAVGYLRQAITLDSSKARAFISLAKFYRRVDKPDSALALLQTAYRLEPHSPLVLTSLGRAYAAVGYDLAESEPEAAPSRFASAEEHLHEALRRDSTQAEALVELASLQLFRDQVDSSIVFLARLERSDLLPPGELHLLGDRYRFKQHHELAMRAYRLAIRHGVNVLVAQALKEAFPELKEPLAN